MTVRLIVAGLMLAGLTAVTGSPGRLPRARTAVTWYPSRGAPTYEELLANSQSGADSLSAEARRALVGLHPPGRLGRAQEVAEPVVWLSRERASFVTGAYYPVDGRYLAQ
jgi:NAD(P)-dependent dehydrogenase (short-subunit alcohol dehydrogenase family)